jgi:cyclophilin family peptidyl-prolyl cis-trans isomerase
MPLETGRAPQEYRELLERSLREPSPEVEIVTDSGTIRLRLLAADAPTTVESFLRLADRGYFDGQEWPRVVPNFVVQGGDPRGDTNGGPGYTLRDEINRHRYDTGTLGMALSGPDTGGSQFFITHSPQPHLDGTYAVFGEVVQGQAVTQVILPGDRIHQIRRVQ